MASQDLALTEDAQLALTEDSQSLTQDSQLALTEDSQLALTEDSQLLTQTSQLALTEDPQLSTARTAHIEKLAARLAGLENKIAARSPQEQSGLRVGAASDHTARPRLQQAPSRRIGESIKVIAEGFQEARRRNSTRR